MGEARTRLDALRALLEQVEAGTATGGPDALAVPLDKSQLIADAFDDDGDETDIWGNVVAAHDGSLDAAKALHEAVLPGWDVSDFRRCGRLLGHPWGITLEKWNASNPSKNMSSHAGYGGYNGLDLYQSYDPARAWLLAIIRALIAEAEE